MNQRKTFAQVLTDGIAQPYSVLMTTRVLENNLKYLEQLRASLEASGKKDIPDVREYGDTMAATLLAGVETSIDYYDLLVLIEHFKDGLASRRIN